MKKPITVVKQQRRKIEQLFSKKDISDSNFNFSCRNSVNIFQSALLARRQKQYQKSITLFQQAYQSIRSYKGSLSQKQQRLFLQMRVSILSHLLAQYLLFGRQNEQHLKQTVYNLKKNISHRQQFQIACYLLFGIRSLLSIVDFQFLIGANDQKQFQYDQLTQAYFWHTIGKLKMAKHWNQKLKKEQKINEKNKESSLLKSSRSKRIDQYKNYVDQIKGQNNALVALKKSLDICFRNDYRNLGRQNINLLQQIQPGFIQKLENAKYKIIYSNTFKNLTECVNFDYVLKQMIQIEESVEQTQQTQVNHPQNFYNSQFIKSVLAFSIKSFKQNTKQNSNDAMTNIQSRNFMYKKILQQNNIMVLKKVTNTQFFIKSLAIYKKKIEFMIQKITTMEKYLQMQKSFKKLCSFNIQKNLKTPSKQATMSMSQSMMIKYPWSTSNNSKIKGSQETKKIIKAKKAPNIQSIKKQWRQCLQGQYLIKLNYHNAQKKIKYLQLTQSQIRWSDSETSISSSFSSYKLKYIKGIVYGAVTERFNIQKDQMESWKCFSIIGRDRTLDFYCKGQQKDILFWLPGITYHMKTYISASFQIYPVGRALWKMVTLKSKQRFFGKKRIQETQYVKSARKRQMKQKKYSKIPYKILSTYRIQIGDFSKMSTSVKN